MEILKKQYCVYNCMCITYAMDTSSLKYVFNEIDLPSFEEVLVYITNLLLSTYTVSMGTAV